MVMFESLNEAAVDRILNAVGRAHIPYDFDKFALIRCLDLCGRRYRDAVRFRSDRNEKAAFRHLEQTRKAAKRLETLLISAEVGQWSVTSTSGQPLAYRDVAKQLVEDIDLELGRQRELEKAYADSFKKYAPIDWLVGVYLPEVYSLTFRKEPSISEEAPYVRFAECVLRELNITKSDGTFYKAATISRSLRNVRAGRVRRKTAAGDVKYSHWSFSRLAEAYVPRFPPIIPEMGQPSELIVQIVDRDKVLKFFIETKHPALLVQLCMLANKAIAKGEIVPGCKVMQIIEPDED